MYPFLVLAACLWVADGVPCNPTQCVLPNCRCYNDPALPGNLDLGDVPQIIMVSMYGTVNSENFAYYDPIFRSYVNPNGCPVRGTFFIQEEGTEFSLLRSLYEEGHEIGIQSSNGQAPTSATEWIQMIKSVLAKLSDFGIEEKSVYGVRAVGLAEGGTSEFIGIGDLGLQYDSSCTNVQLSSRLTIIWPYTLDFDGPACDSGQAPAQPFPGRWEVPIADLHDLSPEAIPCAVPSACRNVTTKKDAYDILYNAFVDHYQGKKAPFNLIVDPAWAKNNDFRDATIEFLEYVRAAFGNNVWIVPIHKAIQWIQDPTPIANLSSFQPWSC